MDLIYFFTQNKKSITKLSWKSQMNAIFHLRKQRKENRKIEL